MSEYLYDVFVSYPRQGTVEPWVRTVFVPHFTRALHEELARADIFVDEKIPTGSEWPEHIKHALLHSRAMVAVFSRQYFQKPWCLAEIDSMILRKDRFESKGSLPAHHPVHAIVVHDCVPEVPSGYSSIQRASFKEYGLSPSHTPSKALAKALEALAESVAETIRNAPRWSADFPLAAMPDDPDLPPMSKPRF